MFLTVAALALAFVLAYPTLRWTEFGHRVRAVVGSIDAVQASAERYHRQHGAWPAASPPGTVPRELVGLLPADVEFRGSGYRLAWNRWSEVRRPAPSPTGGPGADTLPQARPSLGTLGGITLWSHDTSLLAALLDHYGQATSFARDSSWTLMIGAPDSASAPAGPSLPSKQ
jgi:hypothetical protein